MIPAKNFNTIALCLILLFTAFTIILTNATAGDNYRNDNNFLTNIYESTLTENGYKTNIIINPTITGIYATENNYKLDLTINTQGVGGSHKENNYRLDLAPEKTFPDISDIAVTNIMLSKIVVGQGYNATINITISNKALNYETFYVIIKANTTTIKTQTTTLTSRQHATITFTWNTTGYAKGNCTITGIAWPVPGETNIADNTHTGGWILITKVGDLGSGTPPQFFKCDGLVNSRDTALYLLCYKGHGP